MADVKSDAKSGAAVVSQRKRGSSMKNLIKALTLSGQVGGEEDAKKWLLTRVEDSKGAGKRVFLTPTGAAEYSALMESMSPEAKQKKSTTTRRKRKSNSGEWSRRKLANRLPRLAP
jgi:hypothetical protein